MRPWIDETYPVVPDGNGVWFPVEAHLEVGVLTELMEQQAEDGIRFGFWDTDDPSSETYEKSRWL
jgi:hypothetical protein